MIQLSYEPAFDPLHAMYRALRLRAGFAAAQRVPRDLLRILDFYLMFPLRFDDVRLRPEHRRLKGRVKQTKRAPPYGPRPEDAVLLERMRPYQDAALETLALQGFFSSQAFEDGWIEAGDEKLPLQISERIRDANTQEAGLMEALAVLGSTYRLEGTGGLKERTGLLEYRYDAV